MKFNCMHEGINLSRTIFNSHPILKSQTMWLLLLSFSSHGLQKFRHYVLARCTTLSREGSSSKLLYFYGFHRTPPACKHPPSTTQSYKCRALLPIIHQPRHNVTRGGQHFPSYACTKSSNPL